MWLFMHVRLVPLAFLSAHVGNLFASGGASFPNRPKAYMSAGSRLLKVVRTASGQPAEWARLSDRDGKYDLAELAADMVQCLGQDIVAESV